MIGFLHYTVPLSIKILICLTILGAMIVLFFWEPGRKKKNQPAKINHGLQYLDMDPERDLSGKEALLEPKEHKVKPSQHITLQELDEYVQTLKRNKISNLDEV